MPKKIIKVPRDHNKNMDRVIKGLTKSDEEVNDTRIVSMRQFNRENQFDTSKSNKKDRIWVRVNQSSYLAYYQQLRDLTIENQRLNKIYLQQAIENERLVRENVHYKQIYFDQVQENELLIYDQRIKHHRDRYHIPSNDYFYNHYQWNRY